MQDRFLKNDSNSHSVEANNRLHPSNLRVGASPSLPSLVSNILRLASAILFREKGAVCLAILSGTDTPSSSTASHVGAAVFDIGTEGLICVTVAAVAGVGVERLRIRHGHGSKKNDGRDELHFDLAVAGNISSLNWMGFRR